MELVNVSNGREVWFHTLERPFVFDAPFPGRRYVAILFVNDRTVSGLERESVVRTLFESGCRYGVFSGHANGEWEDALDDACLFSHPNFLPPEEDFTMTTSHGTDTVENVIFFGLTCTDFADHEFDRYLILFVGSDLVLRDEVLAEVGSIR